MKIIVRLLPLLVTAASLLAADPPAAESPLAPIAFLAGGKWRATLPPAKDGTTMGIELQLDWSENRQTFRFESTFLSGEKRVPYTSGLYYWNPAKKLIAFTYVEASGSLTEGTLTKQGEGWLHEFTITDKTGAVHRAQALLTPREKDVFTNEISTEKDGKFEKVVDVRYERRN